MSGHKTIIVIRFIVSYTFRNFFKYICVKLYYYSIFFKWGNFFSFTFFCFYFCFLFNISFQYSAWIILTLILWIQWICCWVTIGSSILWSCSIIWLSIWNDGCTFFSSARTSTTTNGFLLLIKLWINDILLVAFSSRIPPNDETQSKHHETIKITVAFSFYRISFKLDLRITHHVIIVKFLRSWTRCNWSLAFIFVILIVSSSVKLLRHFRKIIHF